MKAAVVGFGAALLLTGCTSKAEEARKKFEFLKQQHASLGDVCAAGKAMVDAYADTGHSLEYQMADADAGNVCMDAQLSGSEQPYGELPVVADNMAVGAGQ